MKKKKKKKKDKAQRELNSKYKEICLFLYVY